MSWLIDHFWTASAALGLGFALFAGLFLRGGGWKAAGGATAFLAAWVGLWIADALVETPSEQVRRRLNEIVAAAQRGDAEAVVDAVADDYNDGVRDKASLSSLIRRHFSHARVSRIAVAGLNLRVESNERVSAKFVAHVSGEYQGAGGGLESHPIRLQIDFRLDRGRWQMASVQRFDPFQSAKPIPLDRIP
jgi:hypothetical protein